MKTLIILVILLTGGMAWAFTWEGELDPNEFVKWQIIETKMFNSLTMIATAQNPDKGAKVQRIQMFIYINGTLLSYRYFKGGEIYEYELNLDKDMYERRKHTEKYRQSCKQCHNVKLVPRVSI
jgi:hypothetical protein